MPRLRRAGVDDAPRLASDGAAIYLHWYGGLWSPAARQRYLAAEYAAEAIAEELRSGAAEWWLALEGGRLAGFMKLRPACALPMGDGEGLLLDKLYVAPKQAGQGLGSRLIEVAVARATALDETCIWLDVLKNNPGARRLYERHGFEVVGELPFATDLAEIGFWVMRRQFT